MDRLTWTELDVKAARRLWAVTVFNLDDPEVLPAHLRDASRDHWRAQDARPRRRAKHVASDGEEPSRVTVPSVAVAFLVVTGAVIAGAWVLRRL